jgi:hypothetical protein
MIDLYCSLFLKKFFFFRTVRIQQENAEVELSGVASFCESVGTSYPK